MFSVELNLVEEMVFAVWCKKLLIDKFYLVLSFNNTTLTFPNIYWQIPFNPTVKHW